MFWKKKSYRLNARRSPSPTPVRILAMTDEHSTYLGDDDDEAKEKWGEPFK
jgi:hypothetical protein